MTKGMRKLNYSNKDLSLWTNGDYFIRIIDKTQLCDGNSPIMDPIAKMGVAHAFEQWAC